MFEGGYWKKREEIRTYLVRKSGQFTLPARQINMLLILVGIVVGLFLLRKYIKGGQCSSIARMDGKVVLITGCNTGIGKETVVDLCGRGARVLMACRNMDKMKAAADDVIARTKGSGAVALFELDLSSFESIRACAKRINETEEKIDVLINNAGVMMCPLMRTKDGLEMQMGTNHFGHFLFTNLILDKIKASSPSRIINVSSMGHKMAKKMDLEDMNYEKKPYSKVQAYAQSKLANILFTRELARRLQGTGVTCYSVHPGAVYTELSRHIENSFGPFKDIINAVLSPIFTFLLKTSKDGAQTSLTCAVDPLLNSETGKYYSDCKEKEPAPQAKDDIAAKKLWEISEKIVGLN